MSHLRRLFAVVALALAVAPLVASAPLFDPDEGLHAAIAQEMVQRGDYVTPTFRGEPFLDKPILFFWAEAASLRLFGDNEAAVRLPPLLFGLFGMASVALLGGALFGAAAGLVAGIVYATMLLPMGVSEVAVHDVGVVPFMCIAAWCLARASGTADIAAPPAAPGAAAVTDVVEREGHGNLWVAGVTAGVALGLSILTKGLVALVFTGIFAVCLVIRRPAMVVRLSIVLAIAVVIAVVVAAPWYVAMEQAHPGYLHYYFVERHLRGYLTATQRHAGRAFWYYVPIVVGGALPWTGYLAGAARSARGHSLRLAVWGWFTVGLVFLSIGESKLLTYALPLFPALAIIAGEYVSRPGNLRLATGDGLFTLGFGVQVMTLALLPAVSLIIVQWRYGAMHPYLWMSLALFSLLTIDAGRRAARSASEYGYLAGIVRMTLFTTVALMVVAPRAAVWMTGRDLAATLNTAEHLPPRLSVLDERIGSLIFYLAPRLRAEATPDRVESASFQEAVARIHVAPGDAVLAVRNTQLPRFNRLFPAPPAPDARAGTFTLFRADTLRAELARR